jgi:hypothetical protein
MEPNHHHQKIVGLNSQEEENKIEMIKKNRMKEKKEVKRALPFILLLQMKK